MTQHRVDPTSPKTLELAANSTDLAGGALGGLLALIAEDAKTASARRGAEHDDHRDASASWDAIVRQVYGDDVPAVESADSSSGSNHNELALSAHPQNAAKAARLDAFTALARQAADARANAFADAHDIEHGLAALTDALDAGDSATAKSASSAIVVERTTATPANPRVVLTAVPNSRRQRSDRSRHRLIALGATFALAASVAGVFFMRPSADSHSTQTNAANPTPADLRTAEVGTIPAMAPDLNAGNQPIVAEVTYVGDHSTSRGLAANTPTRVPGANALQRGDVVRNDQQLLLDSGSIGLTQLRADGVAAVTWVIDASAEPVAARIVHAVSPLVVELTRGAIEAEVTPVAAGEAYAIDVGPTRVAVHGTHLRVERRANMVLVDLVHGEIAVGPIPNNFARTAGRTIHAPAHLEFAADRPGEMQVRVVGVRSPLDVFETMRTQTGNQGKPALAADPATGLSLLQRPSAQVPNSPNSVPVLDTTAATPNMVTTAAIATAEPVVRTRQQLQAAVVSCIEGRALHTSNDIGVSVQSELSLTLKTDGTIQRAQFSPPLEPAAQECAAAEIYRSRFEGEAASLKLPIRVTR
jgi:hypothetical protein